MENKNKCIRKDSCCMQDSIVRFIGTLFYKHYCGISPNILIAPLLNTMGDCTSIDINCTIALISVIGLSLMTFTDQHTHSVCGYRLVQFKLSKGY